MPGTPGGPGGPGGPCGPGGPLWQIIKESLHSGRGNLRIHATNWGEG